MEQSEGKKIINIYLEKMESHFSDKKYCIPSLSVRQKIEEELDLNDSNMRLFRKFGRHLLKKSTDNARKGYLETSIDKAKKAVWLRPGDPKAVVLLMRLHMPKYKDDPKLAQKYAEEVLSLDPNHVRAKKILESSLPTSRNYLFISVLAAVVLFAVFTTFFDTLPINGWSESSMLIKGTDVLASGTDEFNAQEKSTTDQDKLQDSLAVLDKKEASTNTEAITDTSDTSLPLLFQSPLEGMRIEDRVSKLTVENNLLTYEFNAVLLNESVDQLEMMIGKVSLLDENNKPIAEKVTDLGKLFELPLLPSQSTEINLIVEKELTDADENPVSIQFDIEKIQHTAAQSPERQEVDVSWERPENSPYSLIVKQRLSTPQEVDNEWQYKIGYEITNTGADIHKLQLSNVFLGEDGNELAKLEPVVVQNAPFLSGETRFFTLLHNGSEEVKSKSLSVLTIH